MVIPTQRDFAQMNELAWAILESGFFNYNSTYDWEKDWADYFSTQYETHLETGCTKAVFVGFDVDWVIKVNLPDNKGWNCPDYCYDEAMNYQLAIDAGVEDAFAACYFLDRIEGYDFYIEELVCVDEDTTDSRCYDYASSLCEEEEDVDVDEVYYDLCDEERVCAVFGAMEIKRKLLEFIVNYGINDLHAGNFGYRNGDLSEPVIIDYSGY